jgi:hypothetical protein
MPQCSVPGCTKQGSHKFPTDIRRRRLWLKAIKRDEPVGRGRVWQPGPVARVCEHHFNSDDYVSFNYYGTAILLPLFEFQFELFVMKMFTVV